MDPFTTLTGLAAPLPQAHLDTDQIMPKQFLRGIDRQGLADGFLFNLRFAAPGHARPDFVLNRAPWNKACILVTGPNFGCGSSREHAVWGMRELGIACVLGTTFGGIFSDNCARNGIPAIELPPDQIERLLTLASDPERCSMTVDLESGTITSHADGVSVTFSMDPLRRHMLLNGLDAVALTLSFENEIRGFEGTYFKQNNWIPDARLADECKKPDQQEDTP